MQFDRRQEEEDAGEKKDGQVEPKGKLPQIADFRSKFGKFFKIALNNFFRCCINSVTNIII